MTSEEIWLFPYDNLDFRFIPLHEDDVNMNSIKLHRFDESSDSLRLLTSDSMIEEDGFEFGTLSAKCKSLNSFN